MFEFYFCDVMCFAIRRREYQREEMNT
jgi:hypothetical protein